MGNQENHSQQQDIKLQIATGSRRVERAATCSTDSSMDTHSDNEEQQYVVFYKNNSKNCFGFREIDRMDLPISRSDAIAMEGCLRAGEGESTLNIPVRAFRRSCVKQRNVCCFCTEQCQQGQPVVELPCKHTMHFQCVSKWSVITNPCKMCSH